MKMIKDIKYHFICGKLNFHRNTLNCKGIMSLTVDKTLMLMISVT